MSACFRAFPVSHAPLLPLLSLWAALLHSSARTHVDFTTPALFLAFHSAVVAPPRSPPARPPPLPLSHPPPAPPDPHRLLAPQLPLPPPLPRLLPFRRQRRPLRQSVPTLCRPVGEPLEVPFMLLHHSHARTFPSSLCMLQDGRAAARRAASGASSTRGAGLTPRSPYRAQPK